MNDITDGIRSFPISLPCLNCGQALKETLGRLQDDPMLVCPACQHVTRLQPEQLQATIEGARASIQSFLDYVHGLSKRP